MVPCSPPTLGRQSRIINIEYYAKLRHGHLLCNLGGKFEHTKGQNVGKDLFFIFFYVWSSRNFGPKKRTNIE